MTRRILHLMTAAGLVGLAACKEGTSPTATLFNDSTVTADVATTSGDAMASAVMETMVGNEAAAAMPARGVGFDLFGTRNFNWSRTRTCYDSTGAAVAACSPMSSVRKVITVFTLTGTRSDTNSVTGGATTIFNGTVRRTGTDTVTRVFTSGTETSRVHSGLTTSNDTTAFTNGTVSRTHNESAADSVRGVTWNLPRLTNPFPVSGYIVRIDTVHATFTNATATDSRTVIKIVKITFPPDAQGNVTLTIDTKTCALNLVTHKVSNCH